jgi:pimeloyl-ACP methyl ester carboxylesterase
MSVIDLDGLAMAYRLTGSGTPLVLVAGTGYPGATWYPPFVAALAAEHTVLTFDHRGTGDTPATDERFSTRLFAQDAVRLMDALGLPPAHVVGHSMGGRVAQWMALDRPERVRSLVLAATGTGRGNRGGIPVHTAVHMIEAGYQHYMAEHIAATSSPPSSWPPSPTASPGSWTRSGRIGPPWRVISATSSHARSTSPKTGWGTSGGPRSCWSGNGTPTGAGAAATGTSPSA